MCGVVGWGAVAQANHTWVGHWERSNHPLHLRLDDNMSAVWDDHFRSAAGDWSLSDLLDVSVVPGGVDPRSCGPVAGRVQVCNSRYGLNGWLGQTKVWVEDEHITQAIVQLNDSYFEGTTLDNPTARRRVMCHELGHSLGLDHRESGAASCMNSADRLLDPSASHPDGHDYEELAHIYFHLDQNGGGTPGTGGCAPMRSAFAALEEGGAQIEHLNDGRILITYTTYSSEFLR